MLGWGLLLGAMGTTPAFAQEADNGAEPGLIDRYREVRFETLARRYLERKGRLPILPPRSLATPTDSLRPASDAGSVTAAPPSFPLHNVRPVRHLEKGWFR